MDETLKITSGSPELLRAAKRHMLLFLTEQENNGPAHLRKAAAASIGKTRILSGSK